MMDVPANYTVDTSVLCVLFQYFFKIIDKVDGVFDPLFDIG